jgi:L-asparaginase
MAIKIFVTGGTFDKEYDEIQGKLFFTETHLQKMLELGRCSLDIKIETLMLKDSLDMTENDRNIIINSCKKAKQNKIVITHGTDTMVETAKFLVQYIEDKTVVLTGAMIPIRFGSSDGLFNLGSSLGFVQTLPCGIYISMNGRYFHWDNVRKNKKTGMFEKLAGTNKTENRAEKHSITIDNSNIEKFIKTVKNFVGIDAFDPLSLEDVYSITKKFGLNGIIYLEKFEDKGHVNVLLDINEDLITLYDPLSGVKTKPFNEIHFGIYCKPIGSYREEFQKYEQQFEFDKPRDIWEKYKRKGKLLFDFLKQNKDFNSFYGEGVSNKVDFPSLQDNKYSADCVPISLFVISLCSSLYLKP